MSEKEFEAELMYRMALSVARSMRKRGLVTEEEYRQIDSLFLKKYQPTIGTLLAGKPLLSLQSRKA